MTFLDTIISTEAMENLLQLKLLQQFCIVTVYLLIYLHKTISPNLFI